MRTHSRRSLIVLTATLFWSASLAQAVPLTGGTGPGGVGLTNGTTSLQLWLRAESITGLSDGQTVAAWVDSSGKGNHATASGTPAYEGAGMNGRAAVRFVPGESDTFITANSSVTTNAESFFMATEVANVSGDKTFLGNTGTSNYTLRDRTTSLEWNATGFATDGTTGIRLGVPALGFTPVVFSGRRSPDPVTPADGFVTLYKNGAVTGTIGNHTSGAVTGAYRIGSRHAGSEFFNGLIGEMIVFNGLVSTAERTLIENHLSARFGIAIGNDRYNGLYDRDLFGVGNDGADSVTNTGKAGFGIEVTAGAGPNALSSGEYILAAHQTPTNAIVDFEGGENQIGERWERVWYVDTNGSQTDAVFGFQFDNAGLSGQFDVGDGYSLLFSADDNFNSWEVVSIAPAIEAGNTIAFALQNALLQNGYYTLGINIQAVPEPGAWALLGLGSLGLTWRRRRK